MQRVFFTLAAAICLVFVQEVASAAQTVSFGSFNSGNLNQFQLNGQAATNNPTANGFLLVCPAIGSAAGSAFLKQSIPLVGQNGFQASFSAAFSFKISESGGISDEDGLGADGIVFVINSVTNQVGGIGQGIGYDGVPHSIGIEFDTWNNGLPNDADGNHVGIDTNGNIISVQQSHYSVRMNDGNVHYAWVDFDGSSLSLEVRISETSTRPAAPFMSRSVDLVAILGSPDVYVGFTSATGAAWGNHYITAFAFTNTYAPIATPPPVSPPRDASICDVTYHGYCSASATCPADPTITFPGGQTVSMESFNAISFDSFYAPSGDVEGRTAIRNDLNLPYGQYSFGYETHQAADGVATYGLVVGHNAIWGSTGGNVLPDGSAFPYPGSAENIFVGGTFTSTPSLTTRRTGGPCSNCLDASFDNAKAYYTRLSNLWNSEPATATAFEQYTTLNVNCGAHGANGHVVNVAASDFNNVRSYALSSSCYDGASIVFNIQGTEDVHFRGANINFAKSKVLYNIIGASRTVQIEVGVFGAILAVNNFYYQPGTGVVVGRVIAANFVQVHQINRVECGSPSSPPPPPPSSQGSCIPWEGTCTGLNFPIAGGSFVDFQVISFGDFNADTGDVEGRLAVRNNANMGNGYSIGYELKTVTIDNSLDFSFVAGGNAHWGSGALYPDGSGLPYLGDREDMYVGGAFTGSVDLTARRTGGPGSITASFDASKSCYQSFSSALGAHTDNVLAQFYWSGAWFSCNSGSDSVYYVSMTGAQFSSFTYYGQMTNCNANAQWVINVRGTDDVTLTGASFPANCEGVTYNVIGSRVVHVHDTSVCGHILAPDSSLDQPTGVIVGKVVAGTITASKQINKQDKCANATPSK